MTFKISVVPGPVKEYSSQNDITVREAMSIASVSLGDREIRVNNEKVDQDYRLADGDRIMLVVPVKGA